MGEDAYFMDFGYGTITKLKLINETKCKIIRDFQNTISVRRIRRLEMLREDLMGEGNQRPPPC